MMLTFIKVTNESDEIEKTFCNKGVDKGLSFDHFREQSIRVCGLNYNSTSSRVYEIKGLDTQTHGKRTTN